MTDRSGPLAGVRVIELGGIGPVPFAAMLLADLGPDVITVRRPGDAAVGNPLREIGIDESDVATLRRDGVVG
jgi:alpha-methylacyl-CoA racemase